MTDQQPPEWTFGDRLRKAREFAGLKQSDMAARFRVGRSTIANWEAERNTPGYLALEKWAEVTGVPLDWLNGDERAVTRGYRPELVAA